MGLQKTHGPTLEFEPTALSGVWSQGPLWSSRGRSGVVGGPCRCGRVGAILFMKVDSCSDFSSAATDKSGTALSTCGCKPGAHGVPSGLLKPARSESRTRVAKGNIEIHSLTHKALFCNFPFLHQHVRVLLPSCAWWWRFSVLEALVLMGPGFLEMSTSCRPARTMP